MAIHGLNASADDNDFLLEASLTARIASANSLPAIRINELPGANDANFWIELINLEPETVDLAGYSLVANQNHYTFDSPTLLQPNDIKLVSAETMGFRAEADQIVSLFTPFQTTAVDAQRLSDRSMGLSLTSHGEEQADLRWQFPDRPTPGAPNAFTTESDIVINEIMYHRQPQYAQESFASEPTPQAILPVNSTWRYRESTAALADDWFAMSHPAGADQWQAGAGPIGFQADVPEIATKLTVPLLLPQPITTYYFETDFEFAGAERSFDLMLDYLVDDGAIFYLNGQEVLRINMPDSADSTTFASSSIDIPAWVTGVSLPQDSLQIGTNRLSVEVHQATAVEHDIVMGASLAILEDLDPNAGPIAYQKSDEEWIELFNRSDRTIDISDWELSQAIGYTFPNNTLLAAGDFVVVAKDPHSLAELHGIDQAKVFGPFGGSLADSDEQLILNDAQGNLADQVHYYDGGRWPAYADGGGSSLELRNPRADNAVPEMWAASWEADRAEWYRLQYTTTVEAFPYDTQPNFQELVIGLIDSGELLIDNVSVIEDPQGAANELMQNGSFELDAVGGGASAWRLIGNHGQSHVTVDPDDPNNHVLHIIAESHMHYLSNHLETTLANRARVTNGQTYTISMDAKWVAGSPQFHTELYHKDAARTTILPQPAQAGTPGRQNSTWQANIGPVIDALRHSPAIPSSDDSVTITALVADTDGLAQVDLLYRVDEGSFLRTAMTAADRPGFFSAQIPPQGNRTVVQFFVEAHDALAQVSVFPAAGPESGAMYRVLDGFELDELRHSVHVIMQPEDVDNVFSATNMMDNDRHAATVIYDADEIYYDVGARLKGSMFTRNSRSTAGFNLRFSPEQKFRGVHEVITFDQKNEKELQVRHLINAAGIYGMYDDVVSFTPPHQTRALPTLMSMARYDSEFVESQFSGRAAEGTVFKLEGIRVLQSTVDGNKESLKIYQPIGWIQSFDIADLGDSKERYRWPILISGNRDEDNFEPVIRMGQTLSLNGDELENSIEDAIDVDQWLRVFAMMSVTGIADVYGQAEENPHNLSFYYDPEADKMLALPWDWDFAFQIPASSPLTGRGKNFHKVMRIPKYERQFYGHLLDIVDTVGNSAYFDRWADHYGTMLRESFRSSGNYLDARGDSIRTQIERDFARVDFQITPLNSSTVDAASVELRGQGWVDIREIRLAGSDAPLPVEWSEGDRRNADQWHVHLPLAPGLNQLTLDAYGYQGQLLASQTVEVTSTTTNRPVQDALRISEINYNPHDALTQFGETAVDNDEFEFIELTNIGSEAIDLAGVRLVRAEINGDMEGVEFAFGSQPLSPNQRIVVVQNRAAFESRYGDDVALAVGSGPGKADGEFAGRLGNDGETLTLMDADGAIVQQIRYNDGGE
ncbi:MAG: lamin tail domain-containing protein, partial [Planctomycetales bacterium]|nr:lamin tail domain-containing protein [Planctomycetales bacterium]